MELTLEEALHLGLQHQLAGRLELAASIYAQIVRFDPNHAEALHLFAVVALLLGRLDDAAFCVSRALELVPQSGRYHNTLGEVYRLRGDHASARSAYEQAVACDDALVEPWINLSKLHMSDRDLAAAEAACHRALAIGPEVPEAREQQRAILLRRDDRAAAIVALEDEARRRPHAAEPLLELGTLLTLARRYDEALAVLRRAVALEPGDAASHEALGATCSELGLVEEAAAAFARAQSSRPRDGLRIREATLLPVILEDEQDIPGLRTRFSAQVQALTGTTRVVDPLVEVGTTNFLLAYHGENDRELQEQVARLHLRACPELTFVAPHCRRPAARGSRERLRIGFVSRFFKGHSIGKSSSGLIATLPRDKFVVTTVRVEPAPPQDPMAAWIDSHSDDVLVLREGLPACREQLAAAEFDILFYQDIGMDPTSYYLAFSRLAPVQCVSFGHPVTTGIPTLDYYLSTDDFEPQDAQDHYSEALVRLPTQIAWYRRFAEPIVLRRADIGVDDGDTLYLCPQTLFKFHPAFDEVIARILRADPRGRLVVLASPVPTWGERLGARWTRRIPDVARRIVFVPPLGESAFRGLVALADVVLDTPFFGGYNTSLEALALGVPVVTRPGRFQRGRHTAAFYHRMGVSGLTVDSDAAYVARAVEVANDRVGRQAWRAQLRAQSSVLFEDPEVPTTYARWFSAAYHGSGGPMNDRSVPRSGSR